MPKCHSCGTDATSNTRVGDCSLCFKTDVTFCATCAMWELGPKDTEADFITDLYKEPKKKKKMRVQRQESSTSVEKTSSIAEVPLKCEGFLKAMGKACKLIEDQLLTNQGEAQPFTKDEPKKKKDEEQNAFEERLNKWRREESQAVNTAINARLYGEFWNEYACKVLDNFQAKYKTCKFERKAIQVLLVMHLSAQERVEDRYYQKKWTDDEKGSCSVRSDSKLVKRWHTRTLAKVLLVKHLDAIGTQLGSTVKELVSKRSWQTALACDDFELYMKGLKSPTTFAIDLLAAAGGTAAAQEALELCVILYHALTTTRAKGDLDKHWSQKVVKTNFAPYSALGFFRSDHYAELYEDSGEFKDEVKLRLRALHAALADTSEAGRLPTHPRFPDGNVTGNGRLDAVEKDYLCYLPVMDTPHASRHLRTECEQVVRKRVAAGIKPVRDEVLKGMHHRKVFITFKLVEAPHTSDKVKKLLYLDAAGVTRHQILFTKATGAKTENIGTDLDSTNKGVISAFADAVKKPEILNPAAFAFEITLTYEAGNSRRVARKDNVLAELKTHFTDEGNGSFSHTYSRDTTLVSDDGTVQDYDVEAYLDQVLVAMRDDFYVDQAIGDYPAKLLMTRADFSPKGWFPLMLRQHYYGEILGSCGFSDTSGPSYMTLEQHYKAWKSGESERPAHYLDWRNHKDLWLYDCFPIVPTRRPVFCSLSGQPRVPEPNKNYGTNTLIFDRGRTRSRCVHNFGDKYAPRRSMLLLLDDIIYVKKRKDGSDPITAPVRQKTIDDICERVEMVPTERSKSLQTQFDDMLTVKKKTYGVGDTLIECQIFGGVDVRNEILAFISVEGNFAKLAAQTQLDTHYSGRFLEYPSARVSTMEVYYTRSEATVRSKLTTKAETKTDT